VCHVTGCLCVSCDWMRDWMPVCGVMCGCRDLPPAAHAGGRLHPPHHRDDEGEGGAGEALGQDQQPQTR